MMNHFYSDARSYCQPLVPCDNEDNDDNVTSVQHYKQNYNSPGCVIHAVSCCM